MRFYRPSERSGSVHVYLMIIYACIKKYVEGWQKRIKYLIWKWT